MKFRVTWKRAVWLVLLVVSVIPAVAWLPVAVVFGALWWGIGTYFTRRIEEASGETEGLTEAGDSFLAAIITAPVALVTLFGFIPAIFCWEKLKPS